MATSKRTLICLALFITSCSGKNHRQYYSNYDPVGKSKIRIVVDNKEVDGAEVYRQFYMDFITREATFLVRPNSELEVQFPKLTDSLIQVNMYYGSHFALSAAGPFLRNNYTSFYFPNDDTATLSLDFYPFTHQPHISVYPKTKLNADSSKNDVHFDLRFKNHYVYGSVRKDNLIQKGSIMVNEPTITSSTELSQ
jgi:hypothetical protein